MSLIKIHIPDKAESIRALMAMSGKGRIDCYADNVFMVPLSALDLLRDLGVKYHELGRGGIDYAEKTLGISRHDLLALSRQNPDDPSEPFNLAYLATGAAAR